MLSFKKVNIFVAVNGKDYLRTLVSIVGQKEGAGVDFFLIFLYEHNFQLHMAVFLTKFNCETFLGH